MAVLKIKEKEYILRLEYRELKRLEQIFNGRSFSDILNVLGENPGITDLETLMFVGIQDKELTRQQFSDLLDDALSDPDSGLTFDILLNTFLEAVENSVFIKGLEAQEKAENMKAQLQKTKSI